MKCQPKPKHFQKEFSHAEEGKRYNGLNKVSSLGKENSCPFPLKEFSSLLKFLFTKQPLDPSSLTS